MYSKNKLLDILQVIEDIGLEMNNSVFYINPVSRVSKLHDEKAELLLREINEVHLAGKISLRARTFTRIFRVSCMGILMAIAGVKQTRNFHRNISNPEINLGRNSLVLSHGTYRNIQSENDIYIPIKLDMLNSNESIWLYLDHRGKSAIFASSKIDRPGLHVILPRTMGLKLLIEFIFQSVYFLKKYLSEIKQTDEKYIEKIDALNLLIMNQFTMASYANFNFYKNIEEILKIMPIDNVNITIEGHPHEEIIQRLVNLREPNIRFNYFQTAPFCNAQVGIKSFLGHYERNRNSRFYVFGKNSAEFLRKTNDLLDIETIGFRDFVEEHVCKAPKDSILFAPEAMDYENVKFLEFALKIYERSADRKFRIRIHPDYRPTLKFRDLQKKLVELGFIFSSQSLNEDLCQSSFIVYSGSSVSLTGLAHGVTPVYLKNRFDFDTNPLNNGVDGIFREINILEEIPDLDFKPIAPKDLRNFYEIEMQRFAR